MRPPEFVDLEYTYQKPESGVFVFNTNNLPVNKDLIKDIQIVNLAPLSVGGNHRHPRTEWFIGMGDLVFIWIDGKGEKHEEIMNPEGQIRLFTVPPFVAHAVVNRSKTQAGILFELADGKMKDKEEVKIV